MPLPKIATVRRCNEDYHHRQQMEEQQQQRQQKHQKRRQRRRSAAITMRCCHYVIISLSLLLVICHMILPSNCQSLLSTSSSYLQERPRQRPQRRRRQRNLRSHMSFSTVNNRTITTTFSLLMGPTYCPLSTTPYPSTAISIVTSLTNGLFGDIILNKSQRFQNISFSLSSVSDKIRNRRLVNKERNHYDNGSDSVDWVFHWNISMLNLPGDEVADLSTDESNGTTMATITTMISRILKQGLLNEGANFVKRVILEAIQMEIEGYGRGCECLTDLKYVGGYFSSDSDYDGEIIMMGHGKNETDGIGSDAVHSHDELNIIHNTSDIHYGSSVTTEETLLQSSSTSTITITSSSSNEKESPLNNTTTVLILGITVVSLALCLVSCFPFIHQHAKDPSGHYLVLKKPSNNNNNSTRASTATITTMPHGGADADGANNEHHMEFDWCMVLPRGSNNDTDDKQSRVEFDWVKEDDASTKMPSGHSTITNTNKTDSPHGDVNHMNGSKKSTMLRGSDASILLDQRRRRSSTSLPSLLDKRRRRSSTSSSVSWAQQLSDTVTTPNNKSRNKEKNGVLAMAAAAAATISDDVPSKKNSNSNNDTDVALDEVPMDLLQNSCSSLDSTILLYRNSLPQCPSEFSLQLSPADENDDVSSRDSILNSSDACSNYDDEDEDHFFCEEGVRIELNQINNPQQSPPAVCDDNDNIFGHDDHHPSLSPITLQTIASHMNYHRKGRRLSSSSSSDVLMTTTTATQPFNNEGKNHHLDDHCNLNDFLQYHIQKKHVDDSSTALLLDGTQSSSTDYYPSSGDCYHDYESTIVTPNKQQQHKDCDDKDTSIPHSNAMFASTHDENDNCDGNDADGSDSVLDSTSHDNNDLKNDDKCNSISTKQKKHVDSTAPLYARNLSFSSDYYASSADCYHDYESSIVILNQQKHHKDYDDDKDNPTPISNVMVASTHDENENCEENDADDNDSVLDSISHVNNHLSNDANFKSLLTKKQQQQKPLITSPSSSIASQQQLSSSISQRLLYHHKRKMAVRHMREQHIINNNQDEIPITPRGSLSSTTSSTTLPIKNKNNNDWKSSSCHSSTRQDQYENSNNENDNNGDDPTPLG